VNLPDDSPDDSPDNSMEPNNAAGRVPDVQAQEVAPTSAPAMFMVVEEVEQRSFHDFYAGSRDRIGRALAVTLGDADLAADSVDEAMARAYQKWSSVSRMDNPAGWVYRVGLNVARSRIRRLTRRRRVNPLATVDVPEPTLLEPAVTRALQALPIEQRSVVICRLLLGWSEAETAEALGIRPGTAKSRLHRATTTLANQLSHLRPEAR
jgi:RNA polymerase sigma-70 factor (ECF subfamily)